MLSGGSLPAVGTGAMDTRRWSEAGRSAPAPAGRRVPTRRGRGDRVTGRLCARRRVSGASPSDPACSFQGLRPSARPPGARRRGHVTVCLLGPASSCPCLAGGKRWAWRSGACVATRPLGAGAAHWPRAILTVRRTQGASCSGTRRLSRPLSGSCDLALLFLKKKCGSVSRPPRVSWRPWLFSPRTTEAFSLDKKSRNSSMCVPPGKSTLDGAEPASFLKANVSVEVSGPAGLDGSAHPHPGRRRASRLPHPPPHGQVHVGLSLVLVGPSRGTFWRSWGGNSCPWQIRALNMFSQECFPCNIDSRAERAAACGRGPSRASAR